jgi:outer membrane usher protein FimD/PapC
VVEFISISTLTGFGVAGGAATAGVICWRLVNFWLPIPFGGIAYLSLRLGRSHHDFSAHATSSNGTNNVASASSSASTSSSASSSSTNGNGNGNGNGSASGISGGLPDTDALPPGLVN